MANEQDRQDQSVDRRNVLKGLSLAAAGLFLGGCSGEQKAAFETFFQNSFREMTKEEVQQVLQRLETEYQEKYGKAIHVKATPAQEGISYAYALDLSRCIGCRRCVNACVGENNQSRDPQVHWITVLEMEKEKGVDLEEADAYYNAEEVPRPGKFYMPVACQQCRNPPCVKVCPVKATWQEHEGMVVVDYNWCIGCRCCMTACPYSARRFNWADPSIPADEISTETEYLGNRPRMRGVVEKCTFCIQRVRQGLYPKCVEACPVGARKFGNLMDPKSEVRYILENKRVFILKEELKTKPRFYYYFGI
jgi:molybdopterin-containing oxidoreductase family iron-sulfur binding subunit